MRLCHLAFLAALISTPLAAQVTPVQSTDASGTITSGGSWQTLFAAASRRGCLIQNPATATEPLYVHDTTASPTLANSWELPPGSSYACGANNLVVNGAIQIEAATTAHAYTATSQ
jgi:hypothetical protein